MSARGGCGACANHCARFVVIASTAELSRKILNASGRFVEPCVVDAGKKILGKTNWVFLDGVAHVEYRKGLNVLFTRKALGAYLQQQEPLYHEFADRWVELCKDGKFHKFMVEFRDLNVAVSCKTFCGDYITPDEIQSITDHYWKITAAMELVNFPIVLPYTKIWYGIQARKLVVAAFIRAADASRAAMQAGKPITCMMDAWISEMLDAQRHKDGLGSRPQILIRDFSSDEIAQTFLAMLFASQDATSSSITWLFQYVADNPHVLEKIREEQLRVRQGDYNKKVDMQMVDEMEYTRWTVKENLRIRPPVLMVPYKTKKPYDLNGYTVPKDSMIIPTFWHSLHDPQAYPEPDKFIPERWSPEGGAEQHTKNWLVFGTGQHVCIGQQYAMMHMTVCLGLAALFLNWEHERTPVSDEQLIFATTFPLDLCQLRFTRRDIPAAAKA